MTVFTLPSWAEFEAGAQAWASGPFTEMLPIAYVAIGLFGGAMLLLWFKDTIIGAIKYLFGHHDDEF